MKLKQIGCLCASICMATIALAEEVKDEPELVADFPNLSAVYKEFKPMSGGLKKVNSSWLKYAYPKGSTKKEVTTFEIQYFSVRTGEYLFSDYFTTTSINVKTGTVIAFPKKEFHVEREFTYIDLDGKGKKAVMNGKWVSVDVIIGYPNEDKMPSEHACAVVVKNLGDNGMMIPMNTGKPGKIIAVKEAARKRFGASVAQAYYHCSEEGRIKILLLRCKSEKENPKVIPATYYGAPIRK